MLLVDNGLPMFGGLKVPNVEEAPDTGKGFNDVRLLGINGGADILEVNLGFFAGVGPTVPCTELAPPELLALVP